MGQSKISRYRQKEGLGLVWFYFLCGNSRPVSKSRLCCNSLQDFAHIFCCAGNGIAAEHIVAIVVVVNENCPRVFDAQEKELLLNKLCGSCHAAALLLLCSYRAAAMLLPCSYNTLYTYLVAQEKELPCDSCHAVTMQLQYWSTTAFCMGICGTFHMFFAAQEEELPLNILCRLCCQ